MNPIDIGPLSSFFSVNYLIRNDVGTAMMMSKALFRSQMIRGKIMLRKKKILVQSNFLFEWGDGGSESLSFHNGRVYNQPTNTRLYGPLEI